MNNNILLNETNDGEERHRILLEIKNQQDTLFNRQVKQIVLEARLHQEERVLREHLRNARPKSENTVNLDNPSPSRLDSSSS